MIIQKCGIIGLGLIGGSIAKALRKYGGVKDIVACGRNPEPLRAALQDGVISRFTTTIDDAFAGCNIVFVCTPVHTVHSQVKALKRFVGRDCIITDVGSTKQNIYSLLEGLDDVCFIGGHPMAGSEQIGYAASVDYLFENAYYLLTPYPNTPEDRLETLRTLIQCMGAIPILLPPDRHDHSVAAVSHVPHVIASALVNTVRQLDDSESTLRALAAGGFRDITRIASSSPEIWRSISFENQVEVLKVLEVFEEQITTFKKGLTAGDSDDTLRFYHTAKEYRDSFQNRTGYMKTYELSVDILDKPGSIATVTTHLSINGINIKNIGVINNREFENGILQIIVASETDYTRSIELLREINFTVYEKS